MRMTTMKTKRLAGRLLLFASALVVVLTIIGCPQEGHVNIRLRDKHLEDVPAGRWLKVFSLRYESGAPPMKEQILEKLHSEGVLEDKNEHEENATRILTYEWRFQGMKIKEEYYVGGSGWRGPKVSPQQAFREAGSDAWVTIETGETPYQDLLPEKYVQIIPHRIHEHTATVASAVDARRLFLFGYGNTCKRISLF